MTAVFQERRLQVLIALATVLLGALLLFSRLGHYALWDDEAMDALSARGVVSTGDTTAVLGENIVAYRNGLLLVNLRHQGMPPLPAYAVAVSFRVFGESAWSARLPFAICGLFCVTLLAWWGFQLGLSRVMQAVLGMAILGNVSLLLYFRNCHYYGFGIFFGAAITYLYLTALQRPVCQWLAALVSGRRFDVLNGLNHGRC